MSKLLRSLSFLRAATGLESKDRKVEQPRFLTYIVTFNCNARCIMCDSWKKVAKDDLKIDEVESVFAQLPKLDGIRLSGGEPFVRRDLAEILRLAESYLDPQFLHITTNGFLTDRIVELCEKRNLSRKLQLLVSMDGTEAQHNRIRGQSFAWERTYATLKALATRQKELNLSLAVNQTIVDQASAEEYGKLRERLKPLGIYNRPVIAYEASATYHLTKNINLAPANPGSFSTFGQLPRPRLEALFSEIEKDVAELPMLEREAKRYYLEGIKARLLANQATPSPDCVALHHHLRIFPNGDVPTCQFNTRVVGNLREQSFADIWKSSTRKDQREWVKACPGCWAECEVVPNAIYSGDLLRHRFRRMKKAGARPVGTGLAAANREHQV